jgi:hypothetical protein
MKSRKEFYDLYFSALSKKHYVIKPSSSADYIADIYYKDRLVAFYSRGDKIIRNPFLDVKDNILDALNDTARSCALRAGICVDKPYDEKTAEKLPDGSFKLSEYGDIVLTCKQHHLFDYIFTTYRLSPDDAQKMQREVFYNKADALQNFATRSGLVDERLLFSETELKIIRSNLIKMAVNFDAEMSAGSIKALKTLVERIEEVKPELSDRENEFDFSQDFKYEELEIGD